MRFTVALLATLLTTSAFADNDRKDPFGDKLLTAGAATFTIAYAPMTVTGTVFSALTGGQLDYGGQFFAPVAGPFYTMGMMASYHSSNGTILFGTLSFLDGAAQVVGIGLMIGGAVHRHRVAARATPAVAMLR